MEGHLCKVTPNGSWRLPDEAAADKQIAIIAALAEGSSIRSVERMTGVHRDTIMRLGAKSARVVRVSSSLTRALMVVVESVTSSRPPNKALQPTGSVPIS
jgi:hypothetical protein